MQFDQSFAHAYECEFLASPPPGDVKRYCYPGGIAGAWVHGVGVKITPQSGAETWVGSFAEGDVAPSAPTGIFSHPDRNRILVVARGDGHVVNVLSPNEFTWLHQIVPIMGIVPIPDLGRIVLYDFVRLMALGEEGVLWRTPCLSWDKLTIEGVRDGVVRGYGWDSPNNCNAAFEVDVLSGHFSGGASYELLGLA